MKETFLEKNFHEKMKMGKRGQVTMFIILGILIVIIAGVLLFVNKDKISSRQITSAQIEPIRTYVEECIKEAVTYNMPLLRNYGGKRGFEHYADDQGEDYNILVGYNYIDLSFSLTKIEEGVSEDIKNYLQTQCSLDLFKEYFDIDADINLIKVKVDIPVYAPYAPINFEFAKSIRVDVNYPITVTKGELDVKLDKFNIIFDDEFGRVYHIVSKFISEYTNLNPISYKDVSRFCSSEIPGGGIQCSYSPYRSSNWIKINILDTKGRFFNFLILKR